jgi:Co/Zn/Cd efflux system component
MKKTVFEISKMDCPSEENLIRMKLDGVEGVEQLDFDIPNRTLSVFHTGKPQEIEASLATLKLGEKILSTEEADADFLKEADNEQRKLLWSVLAINFGFFIIEMVTGLTSRSMGLVADSLDMLADSFVYGISLYAVGGTPNKKKNVAKLAGYFQLLLAFLGFAEVLRRFFYQEQIPNFSTMIIVSVLALLANAFCLYLLQKSKSKGEAHMKASIIFTSNDVIINTGVIAAGLLVYWLQSSAPDLIIGTIVFVLVVRGAGRILKLTK